MAFTWKSLLLVSLLVAGGLAASFQVSDQDGNIIQSKSQWINAYEIGDVQFVFFLSLGFPASVSFFFFMLLLRLLLWLSNQQIRFREDLWSL